MKPSLQLRVSQQLVMTPQLQQALKLLQMPVLELSAQLQEALAENVMLEADESEAEAEREAQTESEADAQSAEAGDADAEAPVVEGEFDDSALWDDRNGPGNRSDVWADDGTRPELPDRSDESLREHLFWQLEMEDFSPREAAIGQVIVDALEEDGYLHEPLEGLLAALPETGGFTLAELEAVLARVQLLDPVGVAARDLGECLAIQLGQLDPDTPGRELAIAIARSALPAVAAHDQAGLCRRFDVEAAELDAALTLIRACHPRPGTAVHAPDPDYVIPDVFVRKQDGRWVVEVNRSAAPQLRVNQAYADALRGNGTGHDALRAQLQEARFLVRSLEIRHDTLTKVAMSIVERQRDFLEHGEESMKPMVLRDIAESIEMHESTISRVTSNKYMHTPRGVFEFRHFFSSQLAGTDGSEQSSTAIRAKIRRLIGHENPEQPLSDSRIAKLLVAEGIQVARRTVAKYREAMRIPPSSDRKRPPTR